MAVVDLDSLHDRLPHLFAEYEPPPDWEEDWLIIPIEDPDDVGSLITPADYEDLASMVPVEQRMNTGVDSGMGIVVPDFGARSPFPGAPLPHFGGSPPPPDALAFYLPFHYFHPKWWGIYLVLEGVLWLAGRLEAYSSGVLSGRDAVAVARLFLYRHEHFHHAVEAFATRLEITHRVPLYREPFELHFRKVFGTADCIEEALATAHGYRKVETAAFKDPPDPKKLGAALDALRRYISSCPPGYSRASEFLKEGAFNQKRSWFAEDNHAFAFPSIPRNSPSIWRSFPHAFSGISRVTSRVNYVVRRDSPLSTRFRLGLRYLRYRDLTKRLENGGCRKVREGKGSHEMWEPPTGGRNFSVPRHPGDFRHGTLAKIIKQAGFQMSVSEFIASASAG